MKKLIVILFELLIITAGTYAKDIGKVPYKEKCKKEFIAGNVHNNLTNYEITKR